MAEESSFRVEKLNTENYHSWKFNMRMYLIGKDLWEIVDGSEVLAEDEADEKKKQEFKKRQNLSLSVICCL